jgi:hypothetical protein
VIETLSITILVEGVVCLGYSIWRRKPIGSIFITSIFINLITQSLLWVTLNLFYNHYLITLCVAEILIWVIESFMLYGLRFNQLKIREAFVLSLLMNLSSFGVGWFLPV